MFETIRPYVKGSTLEIGSGIGNISSEFVQAGMPITLSDLQTDYCDRLHQRFDSERLVRGIHQLDLAHPSFERTYGRLVNKFGTVFALNVVEHIADDNRAIENASALLAPGGHLIILVPAYKALYNGLDRSLEHYRRYNRSSLRRLLAGKGFDILHTRYFNLAGIFGWLFSGSLFGKKTLPAGQINVYNTLVPLFRIADEITFHQVGLSVIAVGRKH